MRKLTGLILPALTLALVLVMAAPATAATTSVRDPRGDAPSQYDFTRLTYGNDARVRARAKVVDLRKVRSIFVVKMHRPGRPNATYQAQTRLRSDGSVTAALHFYNATVFERVRCEVRGTWRLKRDVVRLSFPRSCVEWPGDLRMYAFLGRPAASGEIDDSDTTRVVRVPFG